MTEPRIYRASGLGYSLERMVAPHLGYEELPPPAWLQAAFDAGTELEPIIVATLRDKGWEIRDEQKEIELEVIPGMAKVVGHLDGIWYPEFDGPPAVVEIKTMNSKTWGEFQLRGWDCGGIIDKYKWQVSAYLLGAGINLVLVSYNKETKELGYNAISEPFYSIADIANKVAEAERYVELGQLPDGCTDWPCPYYPYHAPIEDPEPAPADLDTLLDAWKEINRKKKIYEAEEKNLREMVKEYVGEIAGKVRGSQGVTVSTNWVAEQVVSYTKPAHWETRITSPREKKGISEKGNE